MRGVALLFVVICALCFVVFAFAFLRNESVSLDYSIAPISIERLEEARVVSGNECLSNVQCSQGQECIANGCINKINFDECQDVKLSKLNSELKIGQPLNVDKNVILESELKYLLAGGKLVEIINKEPVEHEYVSFISIGDNILEQNGARYDIVGANDDSLYTLNIVFSLGVDFSSSNIRGQTMRILGEEYTIGEASTNSEIYLISEERKLKLQDKEDAVVDSDSLSDTSTSLLYDDSGNVISIQVPFHNDLLEENRLSSGNTVTDPIFDSLKFSFNGVGADGVANIKIGGACSEA